MAGVAVAAAPRHSGVVRFGVFTVDAEAGELFKNGRRIKLQEQPFQLLTILLEQPGRVVTREELRQRLWPADTFVDFDRSLNTAASKLREALGDSADSPRFVETLPRRGYRFVAPVEVLSAIPEAAEAAAPSPPAWRLAVPGLRRGFLLVLGALLILAAGIWVGGFLLPLAGSPARDRVVRFSYSPELGVDLRPVLSPDGRHIAYLSGRQTLQIQDLDHTVAREIEGTEGASHPFWSPASDWVAFGCRQEIQKVAVGGGAVQTVGKLPEAGVFAGGSWSPEGDRVVFAMFQGGLYQTPVTGGKPTQLLAHPHVETPHFLPSGTRGRALLFVTGEGALRPEHTINVHFLDTGKREVITRAMANWAAPVYSSTGHILYASSAGNGTHLWALPFSADAGRATGEPFPIALDASQAPSVGSDGTLVYLDPGNPQRQLVWRDRRGQKLGPVAGPWPDVRMPALSRDGSRLAAVVVLNGYYDVCVIDPQRDVTTRLTFNAVSETHPLWGPRGEQVAFASWVTGTYDVFTKPADGSGEPFGLVTGKEWDVPEDWSEDGRYLVFRRLRADGFGDLWYLKAKEGGGHEVAPLLVSPDTDEVGAKLSPDGRLLAYASNQSGRYEIYVREFPSGGGPWQVSTRGGTQPRWRRDGREVFYVEGHTLVAARVETAPRFAVPAREPLFQCQGCFEGRSHQYDVSADGRRFLVAESVGGAHKPAIRVVQNWFHEFRQPAG
jgi:DNA-binding winged helix-turn-helix (wHTH) protein/Tol biopolymer transport system component